MKVSEDFRAIARDALRGRWLQAALVGLLAGLMGAAIFSSGGSIQLDIDDIQQLQGFFRSSVFAHYRTIFFLGGGIGLLYALLVFFIGGAATLGYAKYNLELVDGEDTDVTALFSQFHRLWPGFCLQFLRWLYTFLWSLLFVIPGIIAQYRYAMAPYIMAEHPEMTASEAIDRSKEMMKGNKFRLFCLAFSFIGWILLAMVPMMLTTTLAFSLFWRFGSVFGAILHALLGFLTVFIPMLFLRPYMEASYAAFYRDISAYFTAAPVFETTDTSYNML